MTQHRVARSVVVDASAEKVFDVLASPRRHAEFDGSGTVREAVQGPERLGLGDEFGMDMRMGLPYRMSNRVVEYEEGRLIAWRHFGVHRWRFAIEPLSDGTCRVTETFDYSKAGPLLRFGYILTGWPARNGRSIEQTLVRLKELVEG